MKNCSTAILTTVYPAVEKYLPFFCSSLFHQTNQRFHVVLVNDGINELSIFNNCFPKNRLTILKPGNNFIQNRLIAISYAKKQGYQKIIFADADDLFSLNRVEVVSSLIEKYPIVVNEIDLIDETGNLLVENYFTKNINPEKTYDFYFIENKNFIGLGNTAVQSAIIPDVLNIPETLKMPDWYFFYKMLRQNNIKAFFTNQAKTLYRQHAENLIGLKEITKKRIELGLAVKQNHYKNLINIFPDLETKLNEIEKTAYYYYASKTNKERYINTIKKLNLNFPLWWEEIKTLNELNIKE